MTTWFGANFRMLSTCFLICTLLGALWVICISHDGLNTKNALSIHHGFKNTLTVTITKVLARKRESNHLDGSLSPQCTSTKSLWTLPACCLFKNIYMWTLSLIIFRDTKSLFLEVGLNVRIAKNLSESVLKELNQWFTDLTSMGCIPSEETKPISQLDSAIPGWIWVSDVKD